MCLQPWKAFSQKVGLCSTASECMRSVSDSCFDLPYTSMSLKLGFYQNCKLSFPHLYVRSSVSIFHSLFLAQCFFHVSLWWLGFSRSRPPKVRSSPDWDTCKVLMGNLHCLLNSKKNQSIFGHLEKQNCRSLRNFQIKICIF